MADKGFLKGGEDDYFAGHNALDSERVRIFKNRARNRHETFNKRMKDFDIIGLPFRSNDADKHKAVFQYQIPLPAMTVMNVQQ